MNFCEACLLVLFILFERLGDEYCSWWYVQHIIMRSAPLESCVMCDVCMLCDVCVMCDVCFGLGERAPRLWNPV